MCQRSGCHSSSSWVQVVHVQGMAEGNHVHGCAGEVDPIKRTYLQLQKAFSVEGVTTPLGPNDIEASRTYPDYFYTPISKYMNNLIDLYRTQLAEE